MAILPVHINSTDVAHQTVIVDGQDISDKLYGASLHLGAGEVPKLILHARAGAVFDGIADVAVGREVDDSEVIASWLNNLDPDILEKTVLDEFEGTHGQTVLTILKRWAAGG